MKPHSYRDPEALHITGSNLVGHRSSCEREIHAVNARPPPTAPYRRYPSLSDDGQPRFPRPRRARRNANKKIAVVNPATESDLSPFFSVRTIALLAIVVIIAILVANA